MNRKAYIAKYPLDGNELREVILIADTYWSSRLSDYWEAATANRLPGEPMLQGWYADRNQVVCMVATDQPVKLD